MAPTQHPTDTTHAVEVHDAQAAADVVGKETHPGSAEHLEVLRGLVGAYGIDGVRRMMDALTPPALAQVN